MDVPQSVDQSPAQGHFGGFLFFFFLVLLRNYYQHLCTGFCVGISFYFSVIIPGSTVTVLHCNCMFSFMRKHRSVFKGGCTIYIPTINVWESSFSASLLTFGIATIFNMSCSDRCAMTDCHGLNLHFLSGQWQWISLDGVIFCLLT